jgi:hypothetical protein
LEDSKEVADVEGSEVTLGLGRGLGRGRADILAPGIFKGIYSDVYVVYDSAVNTRGDSEQNKNVVYVRRSIERKARNT